MAMFENILKEMSNHHRDKAELLEYYIITRLNKSLSVYYDSLIKSSEYLEQRKNKLKVMKNINKD